MIIYKATCLINNKIYIGKTIKTLHYRKYGHKHKSKYPGYNIFARALAKYGFENFKWEIICECNSIEELNTKEQYYIKLFNSTSSTIGYNMTPGGENTNTLTNHPNLEEIKQKISIGTKKFASLNHKGKKYEEIYGKEKCDNIKQKQSLNNIMKRKNVYECLIDKYGVEEGTNKIQTHKNNLSKALIKPKKDLSIEQKQNILNLYNNQKGLKVSQIAKKIKISRYLIQTFLISEGFTGPGLNLGQNIKYLNN